MGLIKTNLCGRRYCDIAIVGGSARQTQTVFTQYSVALSRMHDSLQYNATCLPYHTIQWSTQNDTI